MKAHKTLETHKGGVQIYTTGGDDGYDIKTGHSEQNVFAVSF